MTEIATDQQVYYYQYYQRTRDFLLTCTPRSQRWHKASHLPPPLRVHHYHPKSHFHQLSVRQQSDLSLSSKQFQN